MLPTSQEKVPPIVPAGLHLASFVRRIVGIVVDQIVITVPVFALFYAFGFMPKDAITEGRAVWFTVTLTALGLTYETVGIWLWGRTLGKLLARTRAVSIVDGGRLGFVRSFQRSLVPTTLSAIPQVGPLLGIAVYVYAFFDPLRQGVHDKAAGSIVVHGHGTPAQPPAPEL
ncbi:MAG TPA: RDD family protein [Ilumatobacteraceae bacterium]|mgnify:CR=1 FL=1|nr:RDD family protein [Ilumatobacteraceae bacterium]HRB03668.1 RDD family protein [Ilumatobacteraceae bacterium]